MARGHLPVPKMADLMRWGLHDVYGLLRNGSRQIEEGFEGSAGGSSVLRAELAGAKG